MGKFSKAIEKYEKEHNLPSAEYLYLEAAKKAHTEKRKRTRQHPADQITRIRSTQLPAQRLTIQHVRKKDSLHAHRLKPLRHGTWMH